MNAHQGYLRHPTLRGDAIVFVSDDDLWIVATDGGPARRMTWTGPDVAKLIGRKGARCRASTSGRI